MGDQSPRAFARCSSDAEGYLKDCWLIMYLRGSSEARRSKHPRVWSSISVIAAVSIIYIIVLTVFNVLDGRDGDVFEGNARVPLRPSVSSISSSQSAFRQLPVTAKVFEKAPNFVGIVPGEKGNKVDGGMKVDSTAGNSVASSADLNPCEKEAAKCLGMDTALLIVASNRPQYLKRSLDSVLKYHPLSAVPIVVSEDGSTPEVAKVVSAAQAAFGAKGGTVPFQHKHHPQERTASRNGYFKLAAHFKWALEYIFDRYRFSEDNTGRIRRVIILEEDLEVAPDFFE